MTDALPRKYHEIHEEIAATAAAALIECGLRVDQADAFAERVKERIRLSPIAGRLGLYIPRSKYTVDYMKWLILHRWNGTNTVELCNELGIKERRLRALYDEARAERRAPKSA